MILFGALSISTLLLAGTGDDVASRLDRVFQAYHSAGLFDGVALVADRGGVLLEKGYGLASVEWEIPNRPDARYRIGSVTKPLTAILVLQQVAAGRLALDAPLSRYLPGYRRDSGDRVTIRHLLAHTSGIPTYKGAQILEEVRPVPAGDLVRRWCSGDLRWEPGTRWDYNNCGYLLLGVILERVTGRTYAELLRDGITGPAGMTDTGVDASALVLPRRAQGYERDLAGEIRLAPFTEISTALGAGDVYSTVGDLFRLDRALQDGRLLPPEFLRAMFTPDNARTGLGWFVRKAPADHPAAGDTLQFHEGHIYGFFTFVTRIPEREALVVTIDNADSDAFPAIHRDVLRVLYGGDFTPPRIPMGREVGRALRDGGPVAAVARFQELRSAGADSPFAVDDWRALNALGYAVLRSGRAAVAVELFQANAGAFPDRWETWDSLAEGQAAAGDVDLAVRNYERSIALNPRNEAGIEALRRLRGKDAARPPEPPMADAPVHGQAVALDGRHAREALEYLATGDGAALERLAATPASDHLVRHARLFEYDVPRESARALAVSLVTPRGERAGRAETARRSLEFFEGELRADPVWRDEVARALPAGDGAAVSLYLTFGYDVGVATPGAASLNAAHPRFVGHPGELRYQAIHECHHAVFMTLQPPRPIAAWRTAADLLAQAEYALQLEGMAVWAAWDLREREGALDDDPDYVALRDPARIRELAARFDETFARLEAHAGDAGPADDATRAALMGLYGPDRIFYRLGAHAARTIERARGRAALVELVKAGPHAFLDAFRQSAGG